MSLESYLRSTWDGKKRSRWVSLLLRLLSKGYEGALKFHHWSYDRMPFLTTSFPVPVVSVGSIAVGGTGKTPFTHYLAQELGEGVAILSHGYRSKAGREPLEVCVTSTFEEVGDEPLWLKRVLPERKVYVGSARRLSAKEAIRKGAKLLLLDDGMQHRQMKRSSEIVVLDSRDPLSKGRLLPYGRLRDLPARLKHADLIVLNHVMQPSDFSHAVAQLKAYTDAPCVGMRYRLVEPRRFSGKRLALFSGVGQPKRFHELMQSAGCDLVAWTSVDDHRSFKREALISFAVACAARGAELLACTAKDALKLPSHMQLPLPVEVVDVTVEITHGKERMKNFITELRRRMNDG